MSNTLRPMLMLDVIGSVAVKETALTADTVMFAVAIDKVVARSKSNPVAVSVDVMFVLTLAIRVATALVVTALLIGIDDVPGLKATAETVILLDEIGSVVARSKSCATSSPPST